MALARTSKYSEISGSGTGGVAAGEGVPNLGDGAVAVDQVQRLVGQHFAVVALGKLPDVKSTQVAEVVDVEGPHDVVAPHRDTQVAFAGHRPRRKSAVEPANFLAGSRRDRRPEGGHGAEGLRRFAECLTLEEGRVRALCSQRSRDSLLAGGLHAAKQRRSLGVRQGGERPDNSAPM